MKIWRFVAGFLLVIYACLPAVAQQTKAQMSTYNNAVIVTNGVGAITAANLHPLLQNMINSSCTIADPTNCPISALTGAMANLPLIGAASGGGVIQGTVSGNTTDFATVTGTLTNGHCVSVGSGGNLIDAGAACAVGSGSGTVAAATIGQIAQYTGTTTVSGVSIIPTKNGGAACANLEEFGGAGDGSTDNTAAINNVLASFASNINGGCILEGSGRYKLLSPISYSYPTTAPWSISLFGSGSETTIFDWPSGSGIGFTLQNSLHTFHLRDMTLETGGSGSGDAFDVTNNTPPSGVSFSDISNVTFRGESTGANYWTHAFLDSGVSFINFDGDAIWGGNATSGQGVGVQIQSTSAGFGFAIVFNIDNTGFFNLAAGFVHGTRTQGVFISNSNFTNGTTGIFVPSGDVGSDQVYVVNSQFGTNGNSVIIQSALPSASFVDDYFIISTGNIGILCSLCVTTQIVADKFTAATTSGSGAGVVITANSAAGATVTGNTFVNLANGVVCSNPGATCNVQSNAYSGTTAKTSPASSIGNITIGGGSS